MKKLGSVLMHIFQKPKLEPTPITCVLDLFFKIIFRIFSKHQYFLAPKCAPIQICLRHIIRCARFSQDNFRACPNIQKIREPDASWRPRHTWAPKNADCQLFFKFPKNQSVLQTVWVPDMTAPKIGAPSGTVHTACILHVA